MATATEPTATTETTPPTPEDIVRRHIKRVLPVKLTDAEQLAIARDAAKKRRVQRQLENDLADETKKRKQQIAELEKEIATHDRELDTGEQDRVVPCDEVFRAGLVWTRRTDTGKLFESRPATPQEANRYLPGVESTLGQLPANAPLLDQAVAAQGKASAPPEDAASSEPDDEVSDEPEDDGLTELTPAQRAAKEATDARKARRNGGGKGKAK